MSDSDSDDDYNTNIKHTTVLQKLHEEMYGYDPEAADLYDRHRETDSDEEEVYDEEENEAFDIIDASTTTVGKLEMNGDRDFTLIFDEDEYDSDLPFYNRDDKVDFEMSDEGIPFLDNPLHVRPLLDLLGKKFPQLKGVKVYFGTEDDNDDFEVI